MVTRDEELKWAYLLDPCFELTNSAGKPLTDGYIEVYIAGTRNKYYCASDFAGTLHPLQIPLDSLGSNIVLANPDNAYDVYVYNRFGNLVMSRYNVTPADGGAVISNTERINELEELVVSAVTGLQGQIDDINEALDGKKDKQEEYSVTLTSTQTVSAIMQNENGEIEVIYQEIDLPEEVPNVDIVSPASTINITTHIDEETNTKTFSIDLSDLGHLEYGQFMATQDVYTGANMFRIKGNLDTTMDGKIQLHKGNSYHITVRGYYTCSDISNITDTLNYIEYSSFTPMPVNVDNTVAGPQYFEISYDIFKLSADTNYYIAFASNAGKVSNLTVEIHSLSNISILDPEFNYQEGWGIDIVSSVISVDPTIFNDYSTHTEVYEATVTAIQAATSVVPQVEQSDWTEDDPEAPSYIKNKPDLDVYATHDEVYDSSVSSIQLVTGLIPDVSDFATHTEVYESVITGVQLATSVIPDVSDFTTHDEVYEAVVTGVQLATSMIPDPLEAGQYVSIVDNTITVTGLQPEGDYATNTEVSEAIVTAIQVATGAIPDPLEAGQYVSIENNVITVTGLQPEGDYVTHDELTEAVTGIEQDLEGKKDKQEAVEFEGSTTKTITKIIQDDNGVVSAVYEDIEMQNVLEAGQYVSIVNDVITVTGLQPEGDYATNADVYDATVTAVNIATAAIPDSEEVEFEEINLADYALASAIPDVSDFTTHTEVYNATVTAIETVTAMIPEAQVQSDWEQSDDTQPDYIKNKPNLNQYATDTEVSDAIVTAIEAVTAMIPAAQVQSDWDEEDTTDPAYILNKPDEKFLVAGDGINITESATGVVITAAVTGIEGYVTQEEFIEVVSAVTGSGDFGQFYCASGTGACEMAKVRGTIDVTNDGKIKLKEGKSYHVTVRGGYDNTELANVDTTIGLIEYISNRTIQVNVDRSVTGIKYFEISYDLYNLGADTNYYVFFTGVNGYGSIKELFVEIHTLGGAGSGSGGGSGAEYTPGYGINILNNVISLDTSVLPDPQVQSDWAETDNTDVSYIKNKPTELNLVEGPGINIVQDNTDIIISAVASGYVTEAEVYNAVVTGVQAATGLIPDVSDMATQTWVNNQGFLTSVPDTYATDSEVYNAIVTGVQTATALIPDISGYATESWVTSQGYLTSVPDTYATDTEVSQAIASSVTGFVTESQVTALIPESEEVQFEELDITQFAQASAIPVVTGFATKSELSDVEAAIPTVQLNGNDQVTAINNHEIAGTGGTTYTAGEYISIENDEISVTGLEPLPEIIEMDALEIKAGTNIAIVTGVSDITISVTGIEIPDTSDMATKTWVGNQGFLTSIPDTYATDIEVSQAIASSVTGFVTEPEVTALIPDSEEVQFEELDITQFAQASAIPVVTGFATKSELSDVESTIPTIQLNVDDQVTAINNYEIAGIEQVQSDWTEDDNTEPSYIQNKPDVLDIVAGNNITITETVTALVINAEVKNYSAGQYIAIDSNDVISVTGVAAATAIPTFTEGNCIDITSNAISWETTAGITDIQLVNALPASPVSSVLYLIPET